MNRAVDTRKGLILLLMLLWVLEVKAATTLDTIGVTLLRQVDATLTGNGISLAQAEARENTNTPVPFEVNPVVAGEAANLFTYISSNGTANVFPNSVGGESGHADNVALNLYGSSKGVAPQLAHIDNYDGDYFFNSLIGALFPPAIADSIVNQSFVFLNLAPATQARVDQDYDNYAVAHNTLFVSGAGNGGAVMSPATCFNGIAVGAYGGGSSVGPTADNRSKPDITAPADASSFSTPYVSGSAAVLLQAATRSDGGSSVSAAIDRRTLKALLLNGAVKPADWTNGPTAPLDARYGAGIVNLFNSWEQLRGGQHSFIETTSPPTGSPHPPGTSPNNEPALVGWDFNTISNPDSFLGYSDEVNHYYFNLSPNLGPRFTLTATLVWERQPRKTVVNDLNLFLYNVNDGSLVAASTSTVDNVEHLFLTALPAGRYDLQVEKNPNGQVSATETYALAFEFFNLTLNIAETNGNVAISWPITPTGFTLQSATSLNPPVSWAPVSAAISTSSNRNLVLLPTVGQPQFFRLHRP
jgi:hypothetical protein